MARQMETDTRSGPRYLVSFEVRAEWDEPGGAHIMSEGTTENVGPEGTLVHLPRNCPTLAVACVSKCMAKMERSCRSSPKCCASSAIRVIRSRRLQLLGETDEWRGLIWEPAAPRVAPPPPPRLEDDDDG